MTMPDAAALLRVAQHVHQAAAELAKDTKMIARLTFTRHNLEKSEIEHGTGAFIIEWMMPLFGRHEMSNTLAVTPDCKKDLKIDAGTRMNAELRFDPIQARSWADLTFQQRHTNSLMEAHGNPQKDSPDELQIRDPNNQNSWRVKLTYTDKVLTGVSFVHDSDEHKELTDYLYEIVKQQTQQDLIAMMYACKRE